jgi:hypothetical protein
MSIISAGSSPPRNGSCAFALSVVSFRSQFAFQSPETTLRLLKSTQSRLLAAGGEIPFVVRPVGAGHATSRDPCRACSPGGRTKPFDRRRNLRPQPAPFGTIVKFDSQKSLGVVARNNVQTNIQIPVGNARGHSNRSCATALEGKVVWPRTNRQSPTRSLPGTRPSSRATQMAVAEDPVDVPSKRRLRANRQELSMTFSCGEQSVA